MRLSSFMFCSILTIGSFVQNDVDSNALHLHFVSTCLFQMSFAAPLARTFECVYLPVRRVRIK